MKLHVKCDRCGIYVEGVQEVPEWRVSLPEGWTHLRFFGEPIQSNQGLPESGVRAELCPSCTKIVEGAAKAAIERRT